MVSLSIASPVSKYTTFRTNQFIPKYLKRMEQAVLSLIHMPNQPEPLLIYFSIYKVKRIAIVLSACYYLLFVTYKKWVYIW